MFCADKYLLDLEKYIQVLTYQFFSDDKIELFFAVLQGLEQHLCCCITAKNLQM